MKKIIGFSVFILTIALFSCQTDKVATDNSEAMSEKSAQITLTETVLESAALEVEYEVDFYANAEQTLTYWHRLGKMWHWTVNLRYKINQCPDVHILSENGGYPKTITLNYGDSTVLRNGRVLSGVIVIEISGPLKSAEYNRQVSYQDFGVDSLLINGTALVTFDKSKDVFRKMTSNITFTLANGKTIARSSQRDWEWISGMDTELDQNDDMLQITGFSNAETSDGDVYRKEIVEPLIRIRDCRYIVQGIVDITLNGVLISSLNYGDGECDKIAIVIKDGETFEVDLSKHIIRKK